MIAPAGMFAMACAASLLAACAAEVERPTAEMTRAATLIEQAEKAGAQRHAASELQQARERLALADAAANSGNGEVAERLAREASVDAELAVARTASGEAQRAAEELRRGTETLEQEATHNSNTTEVPPSGTSR